MRVLHVANFSLGAYGQMPYSTDRKLHNGLIRSGCCVQEFSYRDVARYESLFHSKQLGTKHANRRLLDCVANFEPDLLLLGHSELITWQTLAQIRRSFPQLKISMWYVDWILDPLKAELLRQRLDIIDTLFITSAGAALDAFRRYRARIHYLPNPVDASIEVNRNDEKSDFEIDFLFCGRDAGEPERAETLHRIQTSLQDLSTVFYGCLGNPVVLGAAFLKALRQSKMGLNFSRTDELPYYSSDRIAQLTGNGILTFSHRVPGLEAIFAADEVIYFDSIEELIEQAHYYHANDEQRRAVASRARARAHRDYDSTRIARYILDLSFGSGATYEWSSY